MAEELEIKLTLAPNDMAKAFEWLSSLQETSPGKTGQLINRYYDTPSADLNRQRIALRVRQTGDHYIQTLKTQGEFVDGAHRRQEWEWPLMGTELNIGLVADTPVGQDVNLAELAPVFETNFERRVLMLDDGEAVIECAMDQGSIIAGEQRLPLNEVEFELKSGDASRLTIWATRLADQVSVFFNLISKAEQGYYLAGIHEPVGLGDEVDATTRLFHDLAIAWLTDAPSKRWLDELQEVKSRAQHGGVLPAWEWLAESLASGASLRSLVGNPLLGQLQAGLLNARS
ncbi:CYTH domain-containing protein [Marinobacter changyiensis]|uniref:CYTH domain-containing protein n=1 Tax=Marinobacter changyiensis TaxID=2604091 RepID=UPI0012659015|nr:CYTH domain-containing protein [Marinobacter changyiensis]